MAESKTPVATDVDSKPIDVSGAPAATEATPAEPTADPETIDPEAAPETAPEPETPEHLAALREGTARHATALAFVINNGRGLAELSSSGEQVRTLALVSIAESLAALLGAPVLAEATAESEGE